MVSMESPGRGDSWLVGDLFQHGEWTGPVTCFGNSLHYVANEGATFPVEVVFGGYPGRTPMNADGVAMESRDSWTLRPGDTIRPGGQFDQFWFRPVTALRGNFAAATQDRIILKWGMALAVAAHDATPGIMRAKAGTRHLDGAFSGLLDVFPSEALRRYRRAVLVLRTLTTMRTYAEMNNVWGPVVTMPGATYTATRDGFPFTFASRHKLPCFSTMRIDSVECAWNAGDPREAAAYGAPQLFNMAYTNHEVEAEWVLDQGEPSRGRLESFRNNPLADDLAYDDDNPARCFTVFAFPATGRALFHLSGVFSAPVNVFAQAGDRIAAAAAGIADLGIVGPGEGHVSFDFSGYESGAFMIQTSEPSTATNLKCVGGA